ncbi:NmrA/HSCARG family protein [Hymenobacter sp. DG25A]|uniref:NmrA/HSCARG family protein n=1 Tax=Hymenobacter sp. DG25A TaxID=1385663 RepID=UPI0006BC29B6|nr:NmrA/HSCARG family protein [Hymenobacter sp. DG25A]ALD20799.1 nucleoside-diphosphate sugar epimerase [Hymenobacter sp. DG25A]
MADKKIIVVFGATGAQGGGLARAILQDTRSEFAVRAVTRHPESEKAQALARLGAEVVSADIDNPESLKKALQGAYGAYFVTFFWDHFSPEREAAEAGQMAEAAKAAKLQHVIWSTLEDTRRFVPLSDDRMPTLQDKYKVPHFDAKGESDQYFRNLGVPTTFLITSFYWENLLYFGMGPKPGPDGELAITFPMGDKKLSGIAVEDIGKCAYGIFKKGKELIGKTVGIAGEHLTCQQMADSLSKALGKKVVYHEVTPEAYRHFGFPGADDLGNMFQFYRDFADQLSKTRDLKFARELNPQLQTFDQWLAKNAAKLQVEETASASK